MADNYWYYIMCHNFPCWCDSLHKTQTEISSNMEFLWRIFATLHKLPWLPIIGIILSSRLFVQKPLLHYNMNKNCKKCFKIWIRFFICNFWRIEIYQISYTLWAPSNLNRYRLIIAFRNIIYQKLSYNQTI